MLIKPFKAFRFNPEKVTDTGSCIAPPYDVISPQQQQQLHQKNEYNIAHITKGLTFSTDTDTNNQYTRAADYFKTWIEKDVLKQDSKESIYGYVQDFDIPGRHIQRISFIALAKLEEFGKIVRPHEQTLSSPIIDRLNLQRATSAQLGLVFMLYDDSEQVAEKIINNAAAKSDPLIDFVDDQDVHHRLYAVTDTGDIKKIVSMMEDKCCTIADGHHRYTTGLAYAKESKNPAAQYQMLAFSNIRHKGLIVLATHRLVKNIPDFDANKLLAELKENFQITDYKFDTDNKKTQAKQTMLAAMKQQCDAGKNAFGIYSADGAFHLAVLKNLDAMDPAAPGKSKAWKSLDVAVLHKLILEPILKLDENKLTAGGFVDYVKDTPNAIDNSIADVDKGKIQAAFLMNPPGLDQIQLVADEGEKMPQKSTYFYPKIFTGLTINKL